MWKTGFHEGQNQSAPGIQTQQGGKKSSPPSGPSGVFFPLPLKWAVLHQSNGQCLQKRSRAGGVFVPEVFQQGRQKAEVSFLRHFRSFPECLRNHPGAEFIPDDIHRRGWWCCHIPLPPFPGRRKPGNIGRRIFHRIFHRTSARKPAT